MPRHDAPPRRGRLLTGAAVAIAVVTGTGALPAPASAMEMGPLVRLTGSSPLAGCRADRPRQQGGRLYPSTEIEPFIAADPTDPDNLLVGVQQDRWSNGGARGNVAVVSRDEGLSWRTVVVPDVSRCSGGEFLRASDPWVDFSPDGVAYFMSLVFQPDRLSRSGELLGFGRNGMLVNRSTDGGRTWGDPITLVETDDPRFLHDKNSLTADPTDPSFVYAVWDRLRDFAVPPLDGAAELPLGGGPRGARARAKWLKELASAAKRAAPGAQQQPTEVFFEGPTLFTRTTNGGRSWAEPEIIFDPGPNAQTINNIVLVQPDGTVINFFTHIYPNGTAQIELLRSSSKGGSFEAKSRLVDLSFSLGTITPDAQEPVRDAAILFDVAVDPGTGDLYVVWQDTRFRGVEEIAFSMSSDGGGTWSRAVRINKTPTRANRLRQQAFLPSIAVGPAGLLVVTYYDFRHDAGKGELTDYWAVLCESSFRDCRKAESWRGELRLTQSSFDMLKAPVAGGRFLGDYMGLVSAGAVVHPVFGIATGPGRTDLFTRRITIGTGPAAALAP